MGHRFRFTASPGPIERRIAFGGGRVNQTDSTNTQPHSVGTGRVLELSAAVTDPEAFAQDIRRLLGKRDALLSLWNGLTTIAVPYKEHDRTLKVIECVTYAGDRVRVQVEVKGPFPSIHYESPEQGCCQSLPPVQHDGFTEFVIPELRIAGRVHFEPRARIINSRCCWPIPE